MRSSIDDQIKQSFSASHKHRLDEFKELYINETSGLDLEGQIPEIIHFDPDDQKIIRSSSVLKPTHQSLNLAMDEQIREPQ